MDTEDFSFPRICDNCAYGIDSPPLWNLSPAGSPNPYQVLREGNKGDDGKDCFEPKVASKGQRISCVQYGKKRMGLDSEEDPMDLLWEGFNEELTSTIGAATSSSREVVEFRCGTANGALVQTTNRPGMVVIVKVLKKLFFLNNSHGKPRKRAL